MRIIRQNERNLAGNIYCSFCKPLKVHAVYRKSGFADHLEGFACDEHKKLIREDDGRMTEADFQTWGAL